MAENLLQVKNLKTYFYTEDGLVKSVDDISFNIKEGESVAIVGESGCGKSITAMSIMKLIPSPGKIENGEVLFQDKNILKLKDEELRNMRGNNVSVIFQEPMTSLNPVFTIGYQIEETVILHRGVNKKDARKVAIDMLKLVGIPRAEGIVDCYPHELSGGMRQRVMIAMAMSCNPKLLIADEPTTALDVTIQAQILELMKDIKEKFNTSIMLITHDLGVVAEMADYVIVMYAGKIVEKASVLELFKNPSHPYTVGLLKSKPVINKEQNTLYSIPGQVPNPLKMPSGCYFHPRCEKATEKCKQIQPNLIKNKDGHEVACWLFEEANCEKENSIGNEAGKENK